MVPMRLARIYFQVSGSLIRLLAMENSKTTLAMPHGCYLSNSKTIELYERLHADFFNSDKMLINGVYMNIKLTRAAEAFYLLTPSDDTKLRFKVIDGTLFISQVELNPLFLLLMLMSWE